MPVTRNVSKSKIVVCYAFQLSEYHVQPVDTVACEIDEYNCGVTDRKYLRKRIRIIRVVWLREWFSTLKLNFIYFVFYGRTTHVRRKIGHGHCGVLINGLKNSNHYATPMFKLCIENISFGVYLTKRKAFSFFKV